MDCPDRTEITMNLTIAIVAAASGLAGLSSQAFLGRCENLRQNPPPRGAKIAPPRHSRRSYVVPSPAANRFAVNASAPARAPRGTPNCAHRPGVRNSPHNMPAPRSPGAAPSLESALSRFRGARARKLPARRRPLRLRAPPPPRSSRAGRESSRLWGARSQTPPTS